MQPVKPIGPSKLKNNVNITENSRIVYYDRQKGICVYKCESCYVMYHNDTFITESANYSDMEKFLTDYKGEAYCPPVEKLEENYTFMDYIASLGLAPDKEKFDSQEVYKASVYVKPCCTWQEYFSSKDNAKQVGVLLGKDKAREISDGGKGVKLEESVKKYSLSESTPLQEVIDKINSFDDAQKLAQFCRDVLPYIKLSNLSIYDLDEIEQRVLDNLEELKYEDGLIINIKSLANWLDKVSYFPQDALYVETSDGLQPITNEFLLDIKSQLVENIKDEMSVFDAKTLGDI